MLERTAILSFKTQAGKNYNFTVRDIKEDVLDEDIVSLMDGIIVKKLIKSDQGDLTEKNSANVVTKETNEITL